MSTFTMPVEGSDEFEALKARWLAKPVSFGQCNRIKRLFTAVIATGGWHGKVGEKTATRLDELATRDSEGRWLKVRTDTGDIANMWAAHKLMETLEGLAGDSVTTSKVAPSPAKGHRKVKTASVPHQNAMVVEDGQLIMVKTASGIETKRLQVNGNRVTVGRI